MYCQARPETLIQLKEWILSGKSNSFVSFERHNQRALVLTCVQTKELCQYIANDGLFSSGLVQEARKQYQFESVEEDIRKRYFRLLQKGMAEELKIGMKSHKRNIY